MSPRWRQIGRVVAVFTVVGWLSSVAIAATEDEVSAMAALVDGANLRGGLAGFLLSAVWGPVWAAARPPAWLGALLGLIACITGVYLYFVLFPHAWQGDRLMAHKSAKVVVGTYWAWLGPLAVAGGGLSAWWVRRPVAPRGWEKEAEATGPD